MTEGLIHTFSVDASHNHQENRIGIGIVLQGTDQPKKRGPILELIEESYTADGLHKGMEKFALFRALEITSGRGFRRVKLRSDYNQMRTQLKEDHKAGLIYGDDLHRKILRLALKFEMVQFKYCPRRKNQAAHRLARKAAGIQPKQRYRKEIETSDSGSGEDGTEEL